MTYKTPEQWIKELNVQNYPAPANKFTDAQQWLDQKYPNKEKVEEIAHDNCTEKFLIGELTIKDFPKLKKISFISSGDIFKIKLINCPQLDAFECVGIPISPMKEIDFGDSNKLGRVYIPNNLLENVKLSANPTGLVKLYVDDNKLSEQILQTLAPFAKKTPFGGGMTSIHYEYSAKDKEKLKSILSKQEKNLAQLEKEHAFYKNFFDNYLQNKKTELIELKNKMNEEGNGKLEDYLQLKQSEDKNKNREKRLKKILLKKLTNEELQKILTTDQEINELEKQANEIELAELEAKVEIPQTSWLKGWFGN